MRKYINKDLNKYFKKLKEDEKKEYNVDD